jgi:hypothetical protein
VRKTTENDGDQIMTTVDSTSYSLCETCFSQANYPADLKGEDFVGAAIPDSYWDRIHKDLTPELEAAARARPQSALTPDDQQRLLSLVQERGDDWRSITEELGLKSKRETLLEFLRAPLSSHPPVTTTRAEVVTPYNQADHLFLQCELLKAFAD